MRNGGGKQKGASFEREVCVSLSRWISERKRDDIFWRSAMSGGRATVGQKTGKQHSTQVGDISCIHPSGHKFSDKFACECKFYASLDYQGLLLGKGKLLSFWTEIQMQAAQHNKLPFLIARQNRMKATLCLSLDGVRELQMQPRMSLLRHPLSDMLIYDFTDFINTVAPYK